MATLLLVGSVRAGELHWLLAPAAPVAPAAMIAAVETPATPRPQKTLIDLTAELEEYRDDMLDREDAAGGRW